MSVDLVPNPNQVDQSDPKPTNDTSSSPPPPTELKPFPRIVYPISDSQWVSLVQVVPKKSRMTVMKNQHDELDCMEVFMNDFTVYADSFDACLENLSKVLTRCIDINLVLNFEKCHFIVTEGIMLGHLVSNRGIEVDKSKIDIITSLPNPASVREVRSFLGHVGIPGAKELTRIYPYSLSTQLGLSIRAYVWRLQFGIGSRLRLESRS
ncbi:Retrovirus-related Pol polyprotein from transposon opus, partial [Mucuna pruriens]